MRIEDVPWGYIVLILSGMLMAVLLTRLVRVWMDILEAKKMQKQETLQPLLGVVSPNFEEVVKMAEKQSKEEENVRARTRK